MQEDGGCWPEQESLLSFSSQHSVQVLLCVLLVGGWILRAVFVVVVLEDGHHVVVSEVNCFVHGCVSPPVSEGKVRVCVCVRVTIF